MFGSWRVSGLGIAMIEWPWAVSKQQHQLSFYLLAKAAISSASQM